MRNYLVITPFFPTESSFRGTYVYDQVVAIQRSGRYNKVIVFSPKSLLNKKDKYNYNGIEVHYFPFIQMPSCILNGLTNSINGRLFAKTIKEKGIQVEDIDVIHAHVSYYAACALALKKEKVSIKVLLQHHDRDPFTLRNGKWAYQKWNTRYRARKNVQLFERVDCHISISKVVEDNLCAFPYPGKYESYQSYLRVLSNVSNFSSVHIKNSIILYNGVDTSQFYPIKNGKKGFNIGCIGNFVELKDHLTLIKAVELLIVQKQIPDIQLYLVGSGSLLAMCKQYVIDHNLSSHISFKEEVVHQQLLSFYNSLDLFVLPSCYEGFGCVFTEAYACGVPFIACEHQGAAECIESFEQDKWLIKPHDFQNLANLIKQYYTYRYTQKLSMPYDINFLIEEFLDKIEKL